MTAQYTYLMDTGTVSIDTSDLLADVENEWLAAFGATLDLDSSTPQGTMIAAETVARASVMKNNADVANTINPNLSYGVFLDAICALLGVDRGINQSTVAHSVQITGNPSTIIQTGSRVQTENGDIFYLLATVTIPPSGTTVGDFQSQDFGAIPVVLGQLTIMDGTIGWGSAEVTTNTIVLPGSDEYTDAQLKNARNQQLSSQGTSSTGAILAAVLKVPNVTSAQVVENNKGAAGVVNGVTFTLPNAIWVCVAGTPASATVAAALYGAHNGGCPWDFGSSGNGVPVNYPTGVVTSDPYTGLPYFVKWTTPILYDAYVHIKIHQTSAESPGASAIQSAIVDFANGLDQGETGFVVGASVSSFEVAGAVARAYPGLYIKDCKVACVLDGAAAPAYPGSYVTEYVLNQFEQAILQIGNVTVEFV